MSSFHTFRANVANLRDGRFPIQPGGDEFISAEIPARYQMGDAVGASMRPIEESDDRSITVTLTLGSQGLGMVQLSAAYAEQEAAAIAGTPVSVHTFRAANGDTISGKGVINPPADVSGGTSSGTRAWQILLSEATYTPAVGLAAKLASEGAV